MIPLADRYTVARWCQHPNRGGQLSPAQKIAKWAADMAPVFDENSYRRSETRTEVCKAIVECAERILEKTHTEYYLKKIASDGRVLRDWNWITDVV
jgi:hypothetical protein